MGTLGGKIGFVAGAAVAFLVSIDMIRLILGDCFFEEGCPNETVGLGAAAIASLLLGIAIGFLVKEVVNRLLEVGR